MSGRRRRTSSASDEKKGSPKPKDASPLELIRAFVLAGWIAWIAGALWGALHADMDLAAGAQVTATLVVAIAFATSFIGGLWDVAFDDRFTRYAGGLVVSLIALGPLVGLDPTESIMRRIVVSGAAFAGVIIAISAGVLASRQAKV
jgi:hypothetical protein